MNRLVLYEVNFVGKPFLGSDQVRANFDSSDSIVNRMSLFAPWKIGIPSKWIEESLIKQSVVAAGTVAAISLNIAALRARL